MYMYIRRKHPWLPPPTNTCMHAHTLLKHTTVLGATMYTFSISEQSVPGLKVQLYRSSCGAEMLADFNTQTSLECSDVMHARASANI